MNLARYFAGLITLAVMVFLPAAMQAQGNAPTVPPSVLQWAKVNAMPMDISAIRPLVAHARVIGLGESQHGVDEFLGLRNQLLEFAVTSLGVTALAAETGYNESTAVDEYISGRGELSTAVIASVFSWSSPVAYSENEALLKWLRQYNERSTTKRKIHFYGIDLTGGRSGQFTEARTAIDSALAYVDQVDSAQATALRVRIGPLETSFASTSYDSLTADQQNTLTAAIDDLVSLFERRAVSWPAATTSDEFEKAYRSAIVARDLNANFRATGSESNPQAQREPAMAKELAWALRREGAQGRILLYQANWHVSKGPMVTDKFTSGLGEYLHASLGQDYVALATSFGRINGADTAPDENSVAALLSKVCRTACWIDLRKIPVAGPVAVWMNTMRPVEGGRPDKLIVPKAFDAILFFPQVHVAS